MDINLQFDQTIEFPQSTTYQSRNWHLTRAITLLYASKSPYTTTLLHISYKSFLLYTAPRYPSHGHASYGHLFQSANRSVEQLEITSNFVLQGQPKKLFHFQSTPTPTKSSSQQVQLKFLYSLGPILRTYIH